MALKRKRAGLSDPMSVVTRFVNACNRHDADGIFACLHPSFDSIQPMYPSRNFRGADQVRRNWQAIFDAEPGFRLTVLRSAVQDEIVWLELHGAGRDAEVAGVFVMGIQGDRIRWARIYSALVEAVPGVADEGAPAHTAAGNGEVGSETIAPVVDIERSGRRRRRSRRREDGPPVIPLAEGAEPEPETNAVAVAEADAERAAEPEAQAETAVPATEPEPEPVAEMPAEAEALAEPQVPGEAEVVVVVSPGQEPEARPEEATGAHDMVTELEPEGQSVPDADAGPEPAPVVLATEPEAVPEAAAGPDDDPPKWRFGKKSR
jgi:limonene-1,2-epoxide hydrolase